MHCASRIIYICGRALSNDINQPPTSRITDNENRLNNSNIAYTFSKRVYLNQAESSFSGSEIKYSKQLFIINKMEK